MKRPVTVTAAIVLVWISAVLGVIGAIASLSVALAASNDQVRQAVENALVQEGLASESSRYLTAGLWTIAIITIAFAVVRVFVAVFLGRGANWARIVITIFAAFSILSSLGALFQQGSWNVAAGIIALLIDVIVLWLIWNPQANAWFREQR